MRIIYLLNKIEVRVHRMHATSSTKNAIYGLQGKIIEIFFYSPVYVWTD